MIVDHFGHWVVMETPDVKDCVDLSKYIGFVYVISFEDGTRYIGAKKIWKRITKPPNTFKRGPNKGFEQSDWREYTSSSDAVNKKIEAGIEPSEYLIVGWYDTWGKTLYAEALLQIEVNIFDGSGIWLNDQIEGHFTRACYEDKIITNNKTFIEYINGGDVGIYRNEIVMDINVNGSLKRNVNVTDTIPIREFEKLIEGRVDTFNDISLPDDIRRVDWKYKHKDKLYKNQTELLNDLGIKRSEIKDNKNIIEYTPENRSQYIKRLKENKNKLYTITRRYING